MRMTTIITTVALTFLTGCGAFAGDPGPAGAPGAAGKNGEPGGPGPAGSDGKDAAVSGTRIRAVFHVAEDGARTMIRWHDSELDTPCRFGSAEDGKIRCYPADAANLNNGGLYYLSPTCDEASAVVQDYEVCPISAYASKTSYADCNKTYRVSIYKVGELMNPSALYQALGASCNKVAAPASLFRRASHIEPAAFVEAVESIE